MSRLFNGSTDRIDWSNIYNPAGGALTISAWIKPAAAIDSNQYIFCVNEAGNTAYGAVMNAVSPGVLDLVRNGTVDLTAYTENLVISSGAWQHVLITHTGTFTDYTTVHLYVDGSEKVKDVESINGSTEDSNLTGYWSIGDRAYGGRPFDGRIAEVAVWDRVLTAGEIANMAAGYAADRIGTPRFYIPLDSTSLVDVITGTTGSASGTTYDADHPTITHGASPSVSASVSKSISQSPSLSQSRSESPSPSSGVSGSASLSQSPSLSQSHSASASLSQSPSVSRSASRSVSASASPSISQSKSQSPSASVSRSISQSASVSPSVPSYILDADHEENDFSDWTGTVLDGGKLSIHAGGLAGTNYCMQFMTGDANAQYAYKTITATKRVRVRFYLNIQYFNFTVDSAMATLLTFYYGGVQKARLRIQREGANTALIASITDDGGSEYSDYYRYPPGIHTGEHCFEIDVKYATSAGANDGFIRIWMDGTLYCEITSVDNDGLNCTSIRAGLIFGFNLSDTGYLWMDEFVANDTGDYLGCLGSASPSVSRSASLSLSESPSASRSASKSGSPSATLSPSASPSGSASRSLSASRSRSPSASVSPSPSWIGNTYYVDAVSGNDSNSGRGENMAWRTLGKVNFYPLQPGDRVLFKRGQSWTGTDVALSLHASGTSDAWIYVGAYSTGARPIIYAGATAWAACYVNNPYCRYESLDFSGANRYNGSTVNIFSHDLYFYDCIMRDSPLSNGVAGLNLSGYGLRVYNVTISHCEVYNNLASGITFSSPTGEPALLCRGIVIEYCTCRDNSTDPANLWYDHGIYTRGESIIRYNTCYNNRRGAGIKVNCQAMYDTGYYPTVYGNECFHNFIGLNIDNDHSLVYNNIAWENDWNVTLAPDCTVVFNTFFNARSSLGQGSAMIRAGINLDRTIVKNNLFLQDRAVSTSWMLQCSDGATLESVAQEVDFDYNIYYSNGNPATLIYTDGSGGHSWTQWRALAGTPDPSSTFLLSLPDLVARYSDPHPTAGGNLVGLGIYMADYLYDADGEPRANPPTPGALEVPTTISASRSISPSPSRSVSPSVSLPAGYSVSPSISQSPSASRSISKSPSISPSASLSPSASKSQSASASPSVAYSFPTTDILDNFNRANEGPPLSSNWYEPSTYGFQVVSNTCRVELPATNISLYSAQTFGPDCEVYLTVTTIGGANARHGVWARATGSSEATMSGYRLAWDCTADQLILSRWNEGTYNLLYIEDRVIVSGYKIGLRVTGVTPVYMEVFTDEGAGWTRRFDCYDASAARIVGRAYLGLEAEGANIAGVIFDDFGGGTAFTSASVSPSASRSLSASASLSLSPSRSLSPSASPSPISFAFVEPLATPAARYFILLKDTTGAPLHSFDHWLSLTYSHALNDIGAYELKLWGKDETRDLFGLDYFVEVYRSIPGLGVGWYRDFIGLHREEERSFAESGERVFVSRGVCPNDLLARRVISYNEGTGRSDKMAPADTAMKEFVEENCGGSANIVTDAGRFGNGVMPNFTVEDSLGTGVTWSGKRAYDNLLQTLQDIAEASRIDFRVECTPPYFTFRTYAGQLGDDRRATLIDPATGLNEAGNAPVAFADYFGNMQSGGYLLNRNKEANAVIVIGKGEKSTLNVLEVHDDRAIADSPWNRRETTINSSNQDGWNPAGTLQPADLEDYEMTQAGNEALAKNRANPDFTFEPLQTGVCAYGAHYFLGDRVTVNVDGKSGDLRITGVSVKVDRSGEQITLEVGGYE